MKTNIKINATEATVAIDLTIDPNAVRISQTHLGTKVHLEDWLSTGKVGGPGLPAKIIGIALPQNMQPRGVLQINILQQSLLTQKPTVLAPLRKPLHDVPDKTTSEIPTVLFNPKHYASEVKVKRPLARLVCTRVIGETPVALIQINPIFFNSEKSLELATKIQLTFKLAKKRKVLSTRDAGQVQPVSHSQLLRLANLARTMVVNPQDIKLPRYSPRMLTRWDYLIITDDLTWNAAAKVPVVPVSPSVSDAFIALKDWKTQIGLKARIVRVSEIVMSTANSGLGADFISGSRDIQHAIRKFLRWAHDNWGTAYVLLGGDQNIVPIRHLPIGSAWDKSLPTDIYYANLDPANDWPEDQPLQIETFDYNQLKPDISIGRAPVTNQAEAATFVRKVISYEQLRYTGNALTDNWLSKVLYVSAKWGGDDPTEIPPSLMFPPPDNQYFHFPATPISIIKLIDKITITQDPTPATTSPGDNRFNQAPGKAYIKIHVGATYKNVQDIFVLTQTTKKKLTKTDKASATKAGWYYTDWTNTDDGPCHNSQGENYPTRWIIVYLSATDKAQSFEIQLSNNLRLDYNLLSKVGEGQYTAIPYETQAANTGLGWYFAKSATDFGPSASDAVSGRQIPTAWMIIFAPAPLNAPGKFILDPAEVADNMVEQEQLRKQILKTNPGWDMVSRLYPDVVDLPLADRSTPEVQYYTKTRLRAKLNSGYHIISLAGHGNPDCTLAGGEGGDFDKPLADQLVNSPHWGILFANSCLTNRYTDDSLSRHLVLKNPNGGLVAYVGFMDEGSIGLGHFVQQKFFQDLSLTNSLGAAFDARASMLAPGSGFDINSRDVRYTIMMMGLLGDPAMKIHGAGPEYLVAKKLAIGKNSDGRLEVAYTRMDDRIYHISQTGLSGAWARASVLDGLAKQFVMTQNADGRLEVIYIGTDNKIYHAWQTTQGGSWTQSYVLDGWAKQLACAQNADGRLEVIYIGTDDKIYHAWQTTPNGTWTQSYVLDGWAKQLTIGKNADGRLEVIYIGTDDKIYHAWQTTPNGTWTQSYVLDGWAKQLAVGKNTDGRLEVIYIGTDDKIYHAWQTSPNGSWTQSYVLDGWAKQLVVGKNADGRLEVIYIGTDDKIYHAWQTTQGDTWTQSYVLDGWAKQLACAQNADGRLEVIYVGTDDRIYHVWQNSPNGTWGQSYLLEG